MFCHRPRYCGKAAAEVVFTYASKARYKPDGRRLYIYCTIIPSDFKYDDLFYLDDIFSKAPVRRKKWDAAKFILPHPIYDNSELNGYFLHQSVV